MAWLPASAENGGKRLSKVQGVCGAENPAVVAAMPLATSGHTPTAATVAVHQLPEYYSLAEISLRVATGSSSAPPPPEPGISVM